MRDIQRVAGAVGVAAVLALNAPAATRVWNGNSGTWDDTNGVPWSNTAAPTTNDAVNLTQATASDIAITYEGNKTLGLTGTETITGTRFGTFTLGNSGGGTTTLAIADGDALPSANDGSVNAGGRLQVTGGMFSPESSLSVKGGSVFQSGGIIKPHYYDLHLANGSTYEISGGTSSFRRLMLSTILEGQGAYGTGVLRIADGRLNLNNVFYVGAATNASFPTVIQTGGVVNAGGWNIDLAGPNALYRLEGGICSNWHGNINGGVFVLTNSGTSYNTYDWNIGKDAGQSGAFRFYGGNFTARGLYLGSNGGTGEFVQAGGTLASWAMTVDLTIGGTTGSGTYMLGDANGPATNLNTGGGQTVRVNTTGLLRGCGLLRGPYYNNLYMSGRVIADGYGLQSDLDLATAADQRFRSTTSDGKFVINASDNAAGGNNGWFAVRKGRLLPPLLGATTGFYVKDTAGPTFNWAESRYADDSVIDLINSAQLTFTGLGAGNGILTGSLLATDRGDISGPMPARKFPLSVHSFSLAANTFSSYTLKIRYDHTAIPVQCDETTVRIWQFTGGAWVDVTGALDTGTRTIGTTARTAFSQFAVTVDLPPPGTIITIK